MDAIRLIETSLAIDQSTWHHHPEDLSLFRRVRDIAKSECQPSSCLSFSSHGTTRLPLDGWIFMKFDVLVLFEKSVDKIQALIKSDKNNVTLHEDQYTFLIIPSSLLRKR
jgi:hypothetical protein